MTIQGAQAVITRQVLTWPGTTTTPHRFGGVEYVLNGTREIGHVHGDSLVDIPFPRKVRDEVVAAGQAEPHHILPESGWVSLFIRTSGDVATAVELLRRSYEMALRQRRHSQTEAESSNEQSFSI